MNDLENGRPAFGIVMPVADYRGGAESMLLRMLKANASAPKTKYYVMFFEDGPMVEMVREMGYHTTVIRAGRMRQPHRVLLTIWRIRTWIKRSRLKLVFSWMEKAHLYTSCACLLTGTASVWYLLGNQNGSGIAAWASRMPARAVICCSDYLRVEQLRHFPKLHAMTVPVSLDLDRFNPDALPSVSAARDRLSLPSEAQIVGIVARLQRWKGVHVFVEAASVVLKTHPSTVFVVVGGEWWGEPEYAAELRIKASQLGLADRMRFVGQQSDIPLWMQAMDVVVHASDNEPAGLVIVEAMALGKAVIAGNSPGPREFADDGKEALFVNYGDVNTLANQLCRLLDDPGLAATLGNNARLRAQTYGSNRIAQRISDILCDLTATPNRNTLSAI